MCCGGRHLFLLLLLLSETQHTIRTNTPKIIRSARTVSYQSSKWVQIFATWLQQLHREHQTMNISYDLLIAEQYGLALLECTSTSTNKPDLETVWLTDSLIILKPKTSLHPIACVTKYVSSECIWVWLRFSENKNTGNIHALQNTNLSISQKEP